MCNPLLHKYMFTFLHLAKLLIYLRKKLIQKLNVKMPNVMFFLTCMNILVAYLFHTDRYIFFSSKYNYSKHVVVRVLYQFFLQSGLYQFVLFFYSLWSVPVRLLYNFRFRLRVDGHEKRVRLCENGSGCSCSKHLGGK